MPPSSLTATLAVGLIIGFIFGTLRSGELPRTMLMQVRIYQHRALWARTKWHDAHIGTVHAWFSSYLWVRVAVHHTEVGRWLTFAAQLLHGHRNHHQDRQLAHRHRSLRKG